MVARLTPDQKVACSNHVGVSDSIFVSDYHHHIIIIIIILIIIIINTNSLVEALLLQTFSSLLFCTWPRLHGQQVFFRVSMR